MRILVIDDSEDGRDIAEAMLLAAGYDHICCAGSAAEACGLLRIGEASIEPMAVDLILLDIMMPEIDGIEACARIRSDPRYRSVPIIMVTALADTGSLGNAFVAGANDYITKPVNRVELLARVRSALKLKAEFDRREARELELMQLASRSGDKRAASWIDGGTGLLAGEMAEAYLLANANFPPCSDTSVIALAVDRLNAIKASGRPDPTILARVAGAVRATLAAIGVVAAIYRDGVIVLVLPDHPHASAQELGERLRAAVGRLMIVNPEAVVSHHVTASVIVMTGQPDSGSGRIHLLTRAISTLSEVTAAGGNRVVSRCA
jgi:PleD family two-component response regulator